MTDYELASLAAKAAGYWDDEFNVPAGFPAGWNPLKDDGDALRLLASLKLNLTQGDFSAKVDDEVSIEEVAFVPSDEKRAEVLRRLIVSAAAKIGKAA